MELYCRGISLTLKLRVQRLDSFSDIICKRPQWYTRHVISARLQKRIIAVFVNTACGINQTSTETVFFPSSSYGRPLEFDLLPPPLHRP